MWSEIKHTYRLSGRLLLALPLIVSVPVPIEAAQHFVEWRVGMFDSLSGA
jgi:hypothetical protein